MKKLLHLTLVMKKVYFIVLVKVGGNAITFLTKYKNLSFKEAVNELSIFAGLQIYYNSTTEIKKKKIFFQFFLKPIISSEIL